MRQGSEAINFAEIIEDIMKEKTPKRIKRGTFEKLKDVFLFETSRRRPKTRAINKLRLNAKVAMDPNFKKGVVISIEGSYDEEDNQSKQAKQLLSRVLGQIKQGLQAFPYLLGDTCVVKEEP